MLDSVKKGRNGQHVHPERTARGERQWKAKLTEADVLVIRARFSQGASLSAIGRDFGVTHVNIGSIVRRETWRQVEDEHDTSV